MSGAYSLSTTVGLTFILPKLDVKKLTKNQLTFSNSIFWSVWKTEQLFIISFHLSLPKLLYKSVLLSVVKQHKNNKPTQKPTQKQQAFCKTCSKLKNILHT